MSIIKKLFFVFLLFSAIFFLPSKIFAVTIIINQFPQSITTDPFLVNCTVDGASAGINYLRIDLYKDGTSNYFGETNNSVSWYNGSDGKQYYPITIVSGTLLTTDVQGRIGNPSASDYLGSGTYKLRIRRYTSSGNPASGDSQNPAEVQINVSFSTPTPSPEPLPTPTAIITPTAIYKINEVKNGSGEVLNNVKIYLDDHYICHYTPEDLTFCEGCQHECDEVMVNYGFGEHKVRLEKSGYKNWEESKSISAGNNFEVNPIMEAEDTSQVPTPTPTPTPKPPTPTPTKKPTPTPKPTGKTATISGEILGEETTPAGFYLAEAIPSIQPETGPPVKKKLLPIFFLGLGILTLFVAAFSLWYTRLRT